MTVFLHKMRWAMYRIGLSQQDIAQMIEHNRSQTEVQKARKAMLRGSGKIVEATMFQTDPSFSTMCKLIRLVTGCESFS